MLSIKFFTSCMVSYMKHSNCKKNHMFQRVICKCIKLSKIAILQPLFESNLWWVTCLWIWAAQRHWTCEYWNISSIGVFQYLLQYSISKAHVLRSGSRQILVTNNFVGKASKSLPRQPSDVHTWDCSCNSSHLCANQFSERTSLWLVHD